MEPLMNALIFTKISPIKKVSRRRLIPRPDPYYEVQDVFPVSVRRTLIKCVRRRLFMKLKQLLGELSRQTTLDLVRRIDSKLLVFAKDKTTGFKIVFRLFGENWPPVIVYRTSISNLKDLNCERSTAAAVSDWRVLFSNKQVVVQRPLRYSRASRVIPLENLYYSRRNIKSVTPVLNRPKRKPFEITYNWRTTKQIELEAKPAFKWRYTPSSPSVRPKRMTPSPLAIFRVRFNREEYRQRWNSLAVARVSRASPMGFKEVI
jgi:hypothetical protein